MWRAVLAVAVAVLAGCAGGAPLRAGASPTLGAAGGGAARAGSMPLSSPARQQRAGGGGCVVGQGRPDLLWLGAGALTGVQFVSGSRGWVVGLNQILFTDDGGRHWRVQDRGHLQLASVDFVDGWHGWAVGFGTVLATGDGGRHWRALPEPCPAIRAVHFVSPLVGFAVAGGTHVGAFSGLLIPLRGGVVFATADGGRTWRHVSTPADVQSVCFSTARRGWLGAGGHLYRTTDGARSWVLAAAGPRAPGTSRPYTMIVQCAGTGTAWGLDIGFGGEASQKPHVGYHASVTGAVPVFAEGYFSYPGVTVHVPAPGSYPGPFSAVSASTAIYLGWCAACGNASAVPWDLATRGGAVLRREGTVGGITLPHAAAFLTPALGWVTGARVGVSGHSRQRIVSTSDGGRRWRIDYTSP